MVESMWGDVKKLSDLLYRQTREQKDILLLKLRLASYASKRDSAFAHLGGLVYKPLKEGKSNIAEDKEIRAAMEELQQIEKDIAKGEKELDELRKATADERVELGEEIGKTWDKTKSAISSQMPAGKSDSPTADGPAPPEKEGGPKKAKKPAKPKTAAKKSVKAEKKESKE